MNAANAEWNLLYAEQEKITGYKSSAERFSEKENADSMLASLLCGTMKRSADQLAALNFPAGSTVLDIGAGPGTLAVPLAGRGCRVTVVEPSQAMNNAMKEYACHCGVTAEIPVIPDVWEHLDSRDIGTYDYVLSSFAMAVPDLSSALKKMHAAAKKQVHIFWFLTPSPWSKVMADLWSTMHPGETYRWRYADLVWNALYQLGICANLTVHPLRDCACYPEPDDAVCDYQKRLCIAEDAQISLLRAYLERRLVPAEGGFTLPDTGTYAHIWWDTEEADG
ncbi:MAG: class I SAM-dependent methyltransferase [Methanocorpusculum sp.]|nr:class I SAM-dependent methyltransferase [Methanocorpusculum sp.]